MASGHVASPAKRSRSEMEAQNGDASADPQGRDASDDDSSDSDFGPAPAPSSAPRKKKRKLPYESLYVAALPSAPRYAKSLMHREQLSFIQFTPHTDFLLTTSTDGVLKFWKKKLAGGDIEFVKEFQAHKGEITALSVSADGRSAATAGVDGTVKIWDVVTFDLLATLDGDGGERANSGDAKPVRCVCWVHGKGASLPLLAVAIEGSPTIRIFDGRGENVRPLQEAKTIHRSAVAIMAYNERYNCVISSDVGGMLEYWRPDGNFEKPESVFQMKSSTNLFDFKKAKSTPTSLTISPNGEQFAAFSFPDRQVRLFDFASGKLHRTYDESTSTISDMQQIGPEASRMDPVEFNRRLAVEKEIEEHASLHPRINVAFDETGNFIMYGSLTGVKVVNTYTNRVIKIYGREEPFRPLALALYQGQPERKGVVTVEMAASDNPLLKEAEERDAVLVATGFGKVRFYMFTNDGEVSKSERDIQNEKPRNVASAAASENKTKAAPQGTAAILHTTSGDIHLRLFPDAAPKSVENFTTHARNGYYNNVIFHRVIRKFMLQTGDPLGDGTGGESIWGGEFADEFSSLKHDKPYTVSMANAGPNTNGSQFFITTVKTPWLDNKHTVFGRAVQGLDVVHRIENCRVHKEKPEDDIRILNITIT